MARRLATLLLLIAIAVAGCGGDGESDSSPESQSGETTAQTTPTDAAEKQPVDKRANKPDRSQREDDKATNDTSGSTGGKKRQRTLRQALARLSPEKRQRFLHRVLGPILKVAGLKGAALALSADLRTLTITVAGGDACRARTTDEQRIARNVRRALKFIRTVVTVVSGGQPLAVYHAANCEQRGLPGGGGRVIFQRTGYGSYSSKPLRIRAKRWIVEYTQKADFFSVFVRRGASGKKYEPNPIVTMKPGSGRGTFKGPGTFRLNINGTGDWTVRVRLKG